MLSQTYETPGPLRLSLEIPAGEIEIETNSEDQTHVEFEALTESARDLLSEARIELRESASGPVVVAAVPAGRWGFFATFGRDPAFRLRVSCPRGSDLEVQTKSASVRARGDYGEAVVNTASGDVSLDVVGGSARVKTASGDVHLQEVRGTADVKTASGDLALMRSAGPVTAQLVSGDIWIRDAASSVALNTVSGDQRVDAAVEGALELRSVSGDIQVGVRAGARVFVDCNTLSGETTSELELADSPADALPDAPLVEVRAKTVSGDIQVLRAPAAEVAPGL
jgi:Putative adhesin